MNKTAEARFETHFVETEVVCRHCQSKWQPAIARFVNVKTHPDARLGILLDTMHHARCPKCKNRQFIDTTFEYYDPDQQSIVQVRPEWEYKAGGGEDWYFKRFEDLIHKYSDIDVRVDVVFGRRELIEKYLGGEQAIAEAQAEWDQRRATAIAQHETVTAHETFIDTEPDEGETEEPDDNRPA